MPVKFGTNQLKHPTPSNIAKGLDIFSACSGGILAWVGTASFISASTSSVIQSVLGLLVTLAQIVKPFFGVKTNIKDVPVEDVKVMDNPE